MAIVRDEHALTLGAAEEALEQPCGIRMGRAAKHATRRDTQRRAFARMDELDRLPLLLRQQQTGIGAIPLPGALAQRELLWRIAGGLYLHDLLLHELLEIRPAKRVHHRERRGQYRAAVGGMTLDELAAPLRIEQVGKALRRILSFHDVGVVADD